MDGTQKTSKSSPISREVRGLPVYQQIYVVIRQRLIDGVIDPEVPLPSENELCAEFQVSRVSIRRALQLLAQDGLIERRRGSGTYPVKAKHTDGSNSRTQKGLIDNLVSLGLKTTAKTLSFGEQTAPMAAVEALGLKKPTCLLIDRLRFYKAQPFSYTSLWLPDPVASLLNKRELKSELLVRLIEKKGLEPTTAEQTISAVAADDEAYKSLGVYIGAPLIRLRRTVLDKVSAPLLFQQSLYLPERFEYRMRLSRKMSSTQPTWSPID